MNRVRWQLRAVGWLNAEKGSSATEFALVLPLLAILLFGLFEVGRLMWSYNIVSGAVRDSSRYAARRSMTCAGFANGIETTYVQRLTRTGTVDAGGTPLLPNWTNDATVSVNISCINNTSNSFQGAYNNVLQIPRVTVSAAAPYTAPFAGLLPGLSISTIRASHSQVWTQ